MARHRFSRRGSSGSWTSTAISTCRRSARSPPSDFAFVAPAEGGSGVEAQYTPFDVFCLALALDLLDVGFKQGEIVYLMRHLRDMLDDWFPDLISRPSLIDRQRPLAKLHPRLPVIERGAGKAPLADARVFLILNRIEMTEVLATPSPQGKARPSRLPRARGLRGDRRTAARLDALMPLHRRTVIMLEIAAVAQAVTRVSGEGAARTTGTAAA